VGHDIAKAMRRAADDRNHPEGAFHSCVVELADQQPRSIRRQVQEESVSERGWDGHGLSASDRRLSKSVAVPDRLGEVDAPAVCGDRRREFRLAERGPGDVSGERQLDGADNPGRRRGREPLADERHQQNGGYS